MVAPIPARTNTIPCRPMESIDDAALNEMPGGFTAAGAANGGYFTRPGFGLCKNDYTPKPLLLVLDAQRRDQLDPFDPCNYEPTDEAYKARQKTAQGITVAAITLFIGGGTLAFFGRSLLQSLIGSGLMAIGFAVGVGQTAYYHRGEPDAPNYNNRRVR